MGSGRFRCGLFVECFWLVLDFLRLTGVLYVLGWGGLGLAVYIMVVLGLRLGLRIRFFMLWVRYL